MASIRDLDLQIEQLKARRARIAQRELKEDRARRTRQQIIVGGFLMANDPAMVETIKELLTRPQDRAVFGLELPGCAGAELSK